MPKLGIRDGGQDLLIKARSEILKTIGLPAELSQTVQNAFEDPVGSLEAHRDELLTHIPEKYRFLLHRVDELTTQRLELLEFTNAKSLGNSTALALGASSELALLPTATRGGTSLLGVRLSVSADLDASAGTAPSVFTAAARAKVAQDASLEFSLEPRPPGYALFGLLDLDDALTIPTDLNNVVRSMDRSRLRRMRRTGQGTVKLGVDVDVADSLSRALEGIDIGAGLGASLSLVYDDRADFSLILEKVEAGYAMELRKTRVTQGRSVLELGVDVELAGLRRKLLGRITAALPNSEPVQEMLATIEAKLDELSEEHLRKRLAAALTNQWEDGKEIFESLVGVRTVEQFADDIRAELQAKIDDIVEANIDLVNAEASGAARTVVAKLSTALGLGAAQRQKLQDFLGGEIEEGLNDVQGAVRGVVKDILPDDRVADYLKPLQGVSEVVDKALAKANSTRLTAKETLDVLKSVHARYVNFRRKVITFVQDDLEERLALTVISEKSRTETTATALRVEFAKPDSDGRLARLYSAMWAGRLETLADLTADVAALPGVNVDGEYVRTVERMQKSAIELNMFGARISAATIFTDEVEVGYDHLGQLTAASTKAEIERDFAVGIFGYEESLSIVARWNVDLLRERHLSAPVTIELVVRDDEFHRATEVEEFFEPLERVSVLRAGVGEQVKTTLFPDGEGSVDNTEIKLSAPISRGAWDYLLVHGDLTEIQRTYYHQILALEPADLREAVELCRAHGGGVLYDFLLRLGDHVHPNGAANRFPHPHMSNSRFRMAYSVARSVVHWKSIIEDYRAAWRQVREVLHNPAPNDTDLEDALEAFNRQFARSFRNGFVRSNLINRGALTWHVAAVIGFFRALDMGQDSHNPFLATSIRSRGGEAMIVS